MRRSKSELLAAVALAWPSLVGAQSDPCAAVIREGVALRREGRDAEALARFRAGAAGCEAPRLRVQIAWAEQALGRWVEARGELRAALRASGDPWVEARRARLEGDLRAIEEHVGEVHVLGGEAGATVYVDGRAVGALPMAEPVPLVVGSVRLEVRLEGWYTVSRDVRVVAGAVTREQVEMRRVLPEPRPSPPPPAVDARPLEAPPPVPVAPPQRLPATTPWRVAGWSLIALGGAALAAGGVSLGMRERSAGEFNALGAAQCFEHQGVAYGGPACASLHADVAAWEVAGAVTLAVGAAAAIAGAVTLWRTSTPARTAALACGVSGRGVLCEGRF